MFYFKTVSFEWVSEYSFTYIENSEQYVETNFIRRIILIESTICGQENFGCFPLRSSFATWFNEPSFRITVKNICSSPVFWTGQVYPTIVFESWWCHQIFFSSVPTLKKKSEGASRTVLGPIQPPIQWVLGVKQPGCEADHSPQWSAEVKNAWSYTSTPPVWIRGVVLS
jgi:hypothetical protein